MLSPNFWKKYFEVYDVLNLAIPYQELLREIIRAADVKKGDKILDAGGGTGNLSMLLKKMGAKVVNLDFCREALDIYKDKYKKAEMVLHDLTKKLPFSDNIFDKIVANNVIYNIPRNERLKTMWEFKRVLKPNGKIVMVNLCKEFKPINIYIATIKENGKRFGFFDTIKLIAKMLIPTIKILYYNSIIQKNYKSGINNLFDLKESEILLEQAGFENISKTKFVYADQAVLNNATKL